MNIENIFKFVVIIFIFYFLFKINSEKFTSTANISEEMKTAINTIYQADVGAIRTLSQITDSLNNSKDGLTVPGIITVNNNMVVGNNDPKRRVLFSSGGVKMCGDGVAHYSITNTTAGNFEIHNTSGTGDLTKADQPVLISVAQGGDTKFKNRIATNGLDPNDFPAGWGGAGIRTQDIYSHTTIACGINKVPKAFMNSEGTITGITFNGTTINCTNLNISSDYRIKDNVNDVSTNDNFNKLRPVTYFNKINNKNEIGFIAHEVQELFPELVNGVKDGENNQSINYIGLIPLLVNEIKELKLKIKQLEEK
jgi:hypothetical protein